jgi:hypothetical protein
MAWLGERFHAADEALGRLIGDETDVQRAAPLEAAGIEGELLRAPIEITHGEGAEVVLGELSGDALEAHDRGPVGLGRADTLQVVIEGGLAGLVAVEGAQPPEHLAAFDGRVLGEHLLDGTPEGLGEGGGTAQAALGVKVMIVHAERDLLVSDALLGAGGNAGEHENARGGKARVPSATNIVAYLCGMHGRLFSLPIHSARCSLDLLPSGRLKKERSRGGHPFRNLIRHS